MPTPAGISEQNRQHLELLHRKFRSPFSVSEVEEVWGMGRAKTRRLLAHLADRGWLARIRRDLYTTVPLGAENPGEWRADPWVVAAETFAPCYLGGWTACEHWGLTEQIFRDVVVISSRRVRHRREEIQGTRFRVKVVSAARLFGTTLVWREAVQVPMSDPSRTVVDLLDDPSLGGGMRQVADVVRAYFASDLRADDLLLEYARQLGNRTAFKRLGYLIEVLGITAPDVLRVCTENLSAGVAWLDPSGQRSGAILGRWGLRLNVRLAERLT